MISEFYIYCDGADLHSFAGPMFSRIKEFIAPYGDRILAVNQRGEGDGSGPDLPPWDLGINYDERDLTIEEQKEIFLFFHILSAEFGRDFVVGFVTEHGQTDDIASIMADVPIERTMKVVLDQK